MRARPSFRISPTSVLIVTFCILFSGSMISAQDRAQFNQETNPVRKAKLFQKLGETQITQFNKQSIDANYDGALQTLTDYRDEARIVFDGLRATGVDAERHSDGFRQLQISLRKGLWEMERTFPVIPEERRAAFHALGDDLTEIQTQLVHMLFPHEAGAGKEKPRG
jgi:hypothetical protein